MEESKEQRITFTVNDVTPDKTHLRLPQVTVAQALDVDGCSFARHGCSHSFDDTLVHVRHSTVPTMLMVGFSKDADILSLPVKNSFVGAALLAFNLHLPLLLRPQHLWIAITQAITIHVEQNSEILRSKFVRHEGKMLLKIDVTDEVVSLDTSHFPREQSLQFWNHSIERLVELITEQTVDDVPQKIGCSDDFSSTTRVENIASLITVMDTCKSYFEYKMYTRCGFPSITLEGTVEDWGALRSKAESTVTSLTLPSFSKPWLEALLPVLDQFVAARNGEVDVSFWECMCKVGGSRGSGSYDWISGWINVFFPLVTVTARDGTKTVPNPFCKPFKGSLSHYEKNGPDASFIPRGISSAPVLFDSTKLMFNAGFIGIEQSRDGVLSPAVGWYIHSERPTLNSGFMTNIGVLFPYEKVRRESNDDRRRSRNN